ncbi:MAG: aspartate carbamoyltransferase catalytic subunit [Chloroflexi bacterium]|nr:aspartate carbamoyltransferase catalytic subunit [Chloroflexota bacterium]
MTAPSLTRRHVLDLDDFSAGEILHILDTADAMKEVLAREVPRVPALRGRTVVTAFYEASTRTRVSFELAARALSADCVNLNVALSSTTKGESLLNTVRTLRALGADVIVMRHSQAGAPYLVARYLNICMINAGDGAHAHPTQALLDLYTMRERLGRVERLKVAIIGDIRHSRVARSNLWGLAALGAQVALCGPATLLPRGPELELLPTVALTTHLEEALEGAEVVMPLRLQLERQQSGLLPSLREYRELYQIDGARLARAHPRALVLHPGPMNEGVEISTEVAHGAQSAIESQVTNGVAVRMALLYLYGHGEVSDVRAP